jgi:hypothetical protein
MLMEAKRCGKPDAHWTQLTVRKKKKTGNRLQNTHHQRGKCVERRIPAALLLGEVFYSSVLSACQRIPLSCHHFCKGKGCYSLSIWHPKIRWLKQNVRMGKKDPWHPANKHLGALTLCQALCPCGH